MDNNSPAQPWPNRLATCRNPRCSILLTGNAALRLLPVVCSLLAGSRIRVYSLVGRGRSSYLSQSCFRPDGELLVKASLGGGSFLPTGTGPTCLQPLQLCPQQLQQHTSKYFPCMCNQLMALTAHLKSHHYKPDRKVSHPLHMGCPTPWTSPTDVDPAQDLSFRALESVSYIKLLFHRKH